MDDKNILRLLLERAENGIDALARRYGKRLMSIAKNILGVYQDAEEAVNDTYLAVWNTVPPKEPDPLSGYVYRTGRNISLDKLKYNTAAKRDGRYDVPIDELTDCIPAPALEDSVEVYELGNAINRFLKTQSRDNRVLFLRRYWFGDSVKDIARDLNLRQNAASVRLGRMRLQLQDFLVKEGFGNE